MNLDVPPNDPRSFTAASLGVKRLAFLVAGALLVLWYPIAIVLDPNNPITLSIVALLPFFGWLLVRAIDWVIRGFRKG